jgi:hypothetical protein
VKDRISPIAVSIPKRGQTVYRVDLTMFPFTDISLGHGVTHFGTA